MSTHTHKLMTETKCKELRAVCPGRIGSRMAASFLALAAVVIMGCASMSYRAFCVSSDVDAEFKAHVAAQEKSGEYIVESLDRIETALNSLHPREGE